MIIFPENNPNQYEIKNIVDHLPNHSITRAAIAAILAHAPLPEYHTPVMQETMLKLKNVYEQATQEELQVITQIFQDKLSIIPQSIQVPEETCPECLQHFSPEERAAIEKASANQDLLPLMAALSEMKPLTELPSWRPYIEIVNTMVREGAITHRASELLISMAANNSLEEATTLLEKIFPEIVTFLIPNTEPKTAPTLDNIFLGTIFDQASQISHKISSMIPENADPATKTHLLYKLAELCKDNSFEQATELLNKISSIAPPNLYIFHPGDVLFLLT